MVALVPRTELIRISYSSLSPTLSAAIVNQLVTDYIQRSYETPANQTKNVSDWLSANLDKLKAQVEDSQEQMMQLERKLGVLGYDSTHNQLQIFARRAADRRRRRKGRPHRRRIALPHDRRHGPQHHR